VAGVDAEVAELPDVRGELGGTDPDVADRYAVDVGDDDLLRPRTGAGLRAVGTQRRRIASYRST
jgi:hypothetical protein